MLSSLEKMFPILQRLGAFKPYFKGNTCAFITRRIWNHASRGGDTSPRRTRVDPLLTRGARVFDVEEMGIGNVFFLNSHVPASAPAPAPPPPPPPPPP